MTVTEPVIERLAIAELQNAYGTAIDQRRWDLLADCFTTQCDVDFGRVGRWTTPQDFVAWADAFHTPLGRTLHQMSTHTATIDGTTATASCYLHAVLTRLTDAPVLHVYSRYLDEVVLTPAGWRLRRRTFESVWRSDDPDGYRLHYAVVRTCSSSTSTAVCR